MGADDMQMNHAINCAFAAAACLAISSPALAQDRQESRQDRSRTVQPYIEVSQVALAELSPGSDVLTYTQVAVGVDTSIQGRNSGASVSLRYERNISYGGDSLDSDTVSGVARGYLSLVPRSVTLEAGALASRTKVDGGGGSSINPLVSQDSESRIYSGYVGPTIHAQAGDLQVNGLARVGYTRVDSLQEDISSLDQRVRDAHVRADVTIPISPTLAVVGGVGYEDIEISSRDAVRDINGVPVLGSDGRYITDKSQPRQLAYDVDGIIWDVGVVWRPSSRTALEAHVGRRYDSTTYYGSFAWSPSRNSSVNISAYDGVSGFGGVLTRSLSALPTEFEAARNALTGDFSGCVAGEEGANCLNVFGSVRSAVFRGRGVQASYSRRMGRYNAAVAAGYDRRKFIAAPGTVLSAANGVTDENYYVATSLTGQLGSNASFTVGSYINWFESGFDDGGDVVAMGTSASYVRSIAPKLSARAALSLDYLDSDISSEDISAATALLGLRYDF